MLERKRRILADIVYWQERHEMAFLQGYVARSHGKLDNAVLAQSYSAQAFAEIQQLKKKLQAIDN